MSDIDLLNYCLRRMLSELPNDYVDGAGRSWELEFTGFKASNLPKLGAQLAAQWVAYPSMARLLENEDEPCYYTNIRIEGSGLSRLIENPTPLLKELRLKRTELLSMLSGAR
ncbi:hypothetical protein LCGC14_1793720 [marine sediment metagenome]|uniref:Uncharacterized protein n=1 Tax=marine sediment metagenome TaxID=412755 RepID=A0A0F9GRR3_9ZZZZ